MVGTILPVGYGDGDIWRFRRTILFHGAAAVTGGALAGMVLGFAGSMLWPYRNAVVGLVVSLGIVSFVSLLYSLHEAGIVRLPRPEVRRQVSADWRRRMPPELFAVVYGLELGAGLSTFIAVTSFYVVVLYAFVKGVPLIGAVLLGTFGLGRWLPLPIVSLIASRNPAAGVQFTQSILILRPLVHSVNAVALGMIGSVFAVVVIRAMLVV